MTRPDTTRPLADQDRLEHELAEAISTLSDRSEWFNLKTETYVFSGRKDGTATVKGSLAEPIDGVPWTPDRWQLIDHVDDTPRIRAFENAQSAVKAALGCRIAAEAKAKTEEKAKVAVKVVRS